MTNDIAGRFHERIKAARRSDPTRNEAATAVSSSRVGPPAAAATILVLPHNLINQALRSPRWADNRSIDTWGRESETRLRGSGICRGRGPLSRLRFGRVMPLSTVWGLTATVRACFPGGWFGRRRCGGCRYTRPGLYVEKAGSPSGQTIPAMLRPYIVYFRYKSPGDKKPGAVKLFRVYANNFEEARRLVASQANYPDIEIMKVKLA